MADFDAELERIAKCLAAADGALDPNALVVVTRGAPLIINGFATIPLTEQRPIWHLYVETVRRVIEAQASRVAVRRKLRLLND